MKRVIVSAEQEDKYKRMQGSAQGANKRNGIFKFNSGQNIILYDDDTKKVELHLATGVCLFDKNSKKLTAYLNFDLIFYDLDINDHFAAYIFGGSAFTSEEFETFFNKIDGKSYDEMKSIVKSL